MSQSAKEFGRRPRVRGAAALKVMALVGLALALGACGGGGGGGGGTVPDGSDGGGNYTPGDGVGNALLTWAAPAERVDGQAIAVEEIAGYRIHFGPEAEPEQYVIDVSDGSMQQYAVTGLAPDTYSFVVSAYDTDGQESGYSNSMVKVIAD